MILSPYAEEISLDIRRARRADDTKRIEQLKKLLEDEYAVQEISAFERCALLHLFDTPIV